MAKQFDLNIITQSKTVYKGRASSLIAPAELGYLGVLADHAPLIANLKNGKLIIKEDTGKELTFPCQKGFLEVLSNKVTVLLN